MEPELRGAYFVLMVILGILAIVFAFVVTCMRHILSKSRQADEDFLYRRGKFKDVP